MTASMRADEQRLQRLIAGVPLGRLGTPLDSRPTRRSSSRATSQELFTGEIVLWTGASSRAEPCAAIDRFPVELARTSKHKRWRNQSVRWMERSRS